MLIRRLPKIASNEFCSESSPQALLPTFFLLRLKHAADHSSSVTHLMRPEDKGFL
jgi:hypothetical protein